MIYDLNIAWTPSTPADALDRTLRQAAVLGYDVVALNHTISRLPIPSPITNPIPILPPPETSASAEKGRRARGRPAVLRRATVCVSDPRDNHRLDAVAAAFDLLAVRPTTEAAFAHACVSLAEPSVISLDLASNLGYHFRPKPVMAAVRRGLRFEVCYSQAILPGDGPAGGQGGGGNARARALFVANLVGLVRASKGRGLVVSSGAPAARPALLRAPADIVNLLAVWGLATEKGLEALSASPRGVVVNEGIKRSSFRGVVDIVQAAGGGGGGGGESPGGTPNETTVVVTGRKKQKQQQQQQQQQQQKQQQPRKQPQDGGAVGNDAKANKGPDAMVVDHPKENAQKDEQQQQGVKRKNDEQAGAGDAADENGQKLSKRQAKKQRRLAAQQAQAAGTEP